MSSTPSANLDQWYAYHIWCADYKPAHNQKCVCVCPSSCWFLFINSEPPEARKARQYALELQSWDMAFLTHASFVHPVPRQFPDDRRVFQSIADPAHCFGPIAPSLIVRLKGMIAGNPTLTRDQKRLVLGLDWDLE